MKKLLRFMHSGIDMKKNTAIFFCDVRSSVLGQNVMFRSVRNFVELLCNQTSLGAYSLMFANCSVFCDV